MEFNYNGKLALINLAIWLILIILYGKEISRQTNRSTNYWFIGLMVILFAVFGFSEADTYHYKYLYDVMLQMHEPVHVENFYYWLVEILPHNYYVWRLVIWGFAWLFLVATFKRLNLEPITVCCVFPILLLQQFIITRGCLGIAIFLYSLSHFLKPGRNIVLSFIIGILGCVAATFLHKSLPLFMFIALFAFIPLNKSKIAILIAIFPLLKILIIPIVNNILESMLFNDLTVKFAEHYLDSERKVANFNGMIRQFVDYLPRFIIFIILIKSFIWRKYQYPKTIRILFQYSFLLFYIALLFLGEDVSSFVTNRTIHMMFFPLTIVVSFYLSIQQKRSAFTILALILFIFSGLFDLTYSIYSSW